MATKESLYKEYIELKNKLNALWGNELIDINSISAYHYNKFTKAELENKISAVEYEYEREVERIRTEQYYNTADGKLVKESLEKNINERKEARSQYIIGATKKVDAFIKDWLGAEWGVGYYLGSSCVNIGLVEKVKDGFNSLYFAYGFTLYYDSYFNAKPRFEMNYGTTGCFKLLSDEGLLRCKYLMGMAKFANEEDKLKELRVILDDFVKEYKRFDNELRGLEYDLSHPLEEKKSFSSKKTC